MTRIQICNYLKPLLKESKFAITLLIALQIIMIPVFSIGPYLFKIFIDDVLIKHSFKILFGLCTAYIIIYLIETLFLAGKSFFSNHIRNKLQFSIRHIVWNNYMTIPLKEISQKDIGDLKIRLDDDVNKIGGFIQKQIIDNIIGFIMILVNVGILFFLSWKISFCSIILIPAVYLLSHLIGLGSKKINDKIRSVNGPYNSWLNGTLERWKEIKSLGLEEDQISGFMEYRNKIADYEYTWIFFWFLRGTFGWIKEDFISKIVLFFIGGFFIMRGDFTIANLLVFSLYFQRIFKYLDLINQSNMDFHSNLPAYTRVLELIKSDKFPGNSLFRDLDYNKIDINNLTFRYKKELPDVLNNFSMNLRKGESLLIKGKSGCGKSTLIKNLLKLVDVPENTVFYDNIDITSIQEQILYSDIGVLMQDPYLFNMSIKDNVGFVKTSATDSEVIECFKMIGFHDFVSSLPDGYNTMVGEKGIKLSGGQKQKIALIRILLKNPKLIILDEPTSALDQLSEDLVYSVFYKSVLDKIVINISHKTNNLNKKEIILS